MEALTAIGLAASIVQFVDFANKVSKKLKDAASGNVFGTLDIVQRILPLLLNSLKAIGQQVEFGNIADETQKAVLSVVEGLANLIGDLEKLLDRSLVDGSQTLWKRRAKVISIMLKGNEKKLDRMLADLQKYLSVLVLHQTIFIPKPVATSTAPLFMVPFARDKKFIRRGDIIEQMRYILGAERLVILAGIGGSGKSQLAIEFSYTYRTRFPNYTVLWINGGSSARLNESYRNIAQALSIPGWIDPSADVQRLVMDWLSDSSREGWLLVIDNADEIEEIFPEKATQAPTKDSVATILRSCANLSQGSVIITTRDSRLENRLATVESTLKVPLMSNSEALELLQTRISPAKYSHSDASDLVEQLERLPLAITQASAFIVENDITISQYLELFNSANNSAGEVLSRAFEDPRRDYRSENSVMRALVLSFNQIREKSPRSAAILSTIANLDRAGIPEALLHDDGESPLQFMEAVGVLKAFSLVLADEEEKTNLKVHRLVQLSIRIWLQTIGQDLFYAQLTMIMVSEKFPSAEYDLDAAFHTWDLCKRLYPHAQTVEKTEPISKEAKLAKAKLQRKMGMYELIRGRHEDSIFRHRQAAIAFREVTDNDIGNKIVALQNMSNLGSALNIAGSFEESEKLHYRACTATGKLLGKDHPLTMMMLCDLADNQVFSRKFNQADKLYRRIYKMRVTLLGEQHLDTLETLSYWGPALEWLGRFEECENVLRHAVNGMRSCLPPDHPKLCYATNRLSSVLQKLGKSEEAEAMARETLRVRLQIYGPGNADIAWSMHVLSTALRDQGKYAEALQLSKQAVQIREDALGRLHLATLIALFNLAFFYRGLCQYQEAAHLYQECTTRMRENYGAWHPLLIVASAERIRMKHHAKFQENHEDRHAELRAYWVAMASRQISVLAQCCGAYNPDHKPWTDVLLLLEAYFLVIVEPLRPKMPLTSGLIILSALILFIAYF